MSTEQLEHFMQSCQKVSERVQEQMPTRLIPKSYDNVSYAELKKFSNWYSSLEQPCPFLQNNSCSIYEHRSIICRDWLVVGSAMQCQLGKSHKKKVIRTSLRLDKVLRLLTSELEHEDQRRVFLYDVFSWYTQNKELCTRTWPAMMLVKHFMNILWQLRKQTFDESNAASTIGHIGKVSEIDSVNLGY